MNLTNSIVITKYFSRSVKLSVIQLFSNNADLYENGITYDQLQRMYITIPYVTRGF